MVPVLNCIGVHAAAVGNHDCECGVVRMLLAFRLDAEGAGGQP